MLVPIRLIEFNIKKSENLNYLETYLFTFNFINPHFSFRPLCNYLQNKIIRLVICSVFFYQVLYTYLCTYININLRSVCACMYACFVDLQVSDGNVRIY